MVRSWLSSILWRPSGACGRDALAFRGRDRSGTARRAYTVGEPRRTRWPPQAGSRVRARGSGLAQATRWDQRIARRNHRSPRHRGRHANSRLGLSQHGLRSSPAIARTRVPQAGTWLHVARREGGTVLDLEVVLATVRDRITKYQRQSIGEQDTKAALIVPV